ncbi:hypothetical protein ISF_04336 [Cordyceps fumosorosea ARSEF 2679]|uniref:Uncharacterized protein n=1 Tax=Cordyceps fumosorosea (strain ARSEF 2679) TaxID=1081104 RepID=A0A167XFR8_CORFA|nr:hypothetical protein ISF_04336 [Cordyceps fumosorosea ARSEF 2679]OAA64926.1 hypothetical protein ISF_04336 [Cordyceps fumosorosea ARSEF 2679]
MTTISLAPPPPSGPSPSPAPAPAAANNSLKIPVRPKFNSHITSDRLREGAGLRLPPFAVRASNIRKGRTSVFHEMGLEDDPPAFGDDTYLVVRDHHAKANDDGDDDATSSTTGNRSVSNPQQQTSRPWYAKLATRPALVKRSSSQGPLAIPAVNVVSPDSQ